MLADNQLMDPCDRALLEREIKKNEAQVRMMEQQVAHRKALLEFLKTITDPELKFKVVLRGLEQCP